MANITTSSNLPPAILQSCADRLLSVPYPNLIHNFAAYKQTMRAQGGTTYRMTRYQRLPTALTPLGNLGIDPAPILPTKVDIDAKMSFYGQVILVNEQTVLQNQEGVLTVLAELLGMSLRETEDVLTRNMLAATSTVINCVGGANGLMPTEPTLNDVSVATQTLISNNASTISEIIPGELRFGSSPVKNAFFGMASTDMSSTYQQVEGFVNVSQYPNQDRVLPTEWGTIQNLRILISSIGSSTPFAASNGSTVYNTFITGMEGYSIIEQDRFSAKFIYRPAIYSGALAQNVSLGWKAGMVPRITNDQWVLNLRATQSF